MSPCRARPPLPIPLPSSSGPASTPITGTAMPDPGIGTSSTTDPERERECRECRGCDTTGPDPNPDPERLDRSDSGLVLWCLGRAAADDDDAVEDAGESAPGLRMPPPAAVLPDELEEAARRTPPLPLARRLRPDRTERRLSRDEDTGRAGLTGTPTRSHEVR